MGRRALLHPRAGVRLQARPLRSVQRIARLARPLARLSLKLHSIICFSGRRNTPSASLYPLVLLLPLLSLRLQLLLLLHLLAWLLVRHRSADFRFSGGTSVVHPDFLNNVGVRVVDPHCGRQPTLPQKGARQPAPGIEGTRVQP
jgi:hypothetical protein